MKIFSEDHVEIHGPFIMQKLRKEGMTMAERKPKPTSVNMLEGNLGKRKLNTKESIPAKRICSPSRRPQSTLTLVQKRCAELQRTDLEMWLFSVEIVI